MLRRGSALDLADVRARLVVEPAEAEVRDRPRGRGDRRAAFLRVHAGVRGPAVEPHGQGMSVRSADDHLPDRRGLVVDVADRGPQPRVVERGGAQQADLLLGREQELDPGVRTALGEHSPRRLEHDGHGRLVVGAEDRAGRVANDAVLDGRLDRPVGRDGVEMRAEEERDAPAVGSLRLEPGEEIAARRPDRRSGVVLVHL